MDISLERIQRAESSLLELLGPELSQIIEAALSSESDGDVYRVALPEKYDVDLHLGDIMEKVAVSSNTYGRITRLLAVAKAEHKIIKGKYDRTYKKNKVGKNPDERERNAINACEDLHTALTTLDAVIELGESLESHARIASESSRKILGAIQQMGQANSGERRGSHSSPQEFSPY